MTAPSQAQLPDTFFDQKRKAVIAQIHPESFLDWKPRIVQMPEEAHEFLDITTPQGFDVLVLRIVAAFQL